MWIYVKGSTSCESTSASGGWLGKKAWALDPILKDIEKGFPRQDENIIFANHLERVLS